MTKCTVIPARRNKNTGKIEDSKLFKDLHSIIGKDRNTLVSVYKKAVSKSTLNTPGVETDAYGEPTLGSLIGFTNVLDSVDSGKTLDVYQKQYSESTGNDIMQHFPNTREGFNSAVEHAIAFNRNDIAKDKVSAIVDTVEDANGNAHLEVVLVKATQETAEEAAQMEYDHSLRREMRNLLESKGIGIGTLNEVEDSMMINGVTDFTVGERTAKGMLNLIRLADNRAGEEALPEEFSHLCLEMASSNPLVERTLEALKHPQIAERALGEEYQRYYEMYNGDPETIAKEALGKLVRDHLLNRKPVPRQEPYTSLLDRLLQFIKNFIRTNFSEKEVLDIMNEVDWRAGEIARNIRKGSFDSYISSEVRPNHTKLYQNIMAAAAQGTLTSKTVLDNILETEYKRLQIQSGNKDFDLSAEHKALSNIENTAAVVSTEAAIYTYMQLAADRLDTIDKILKDAASNPELQLPNRKAGVLLMAKSLIHSYQKNIDDVSMYIAAYPESVMGSNEELKGLLNIIRERSANLQSEYDKNAYPLFKEFIAPYAEEPLKTLSKTEGRTIDLDELLTASGCDISVSDRWLQSAADCNDYTIKILDHIVKRFKDTARQKDTLFGKRLATAYEKLLNAGYTNTEFMHEIDSEGNQTGYYISDYDRGAFYKAKREFQKALEEEFGEISDFETLQKFKEREKEWEDENTSVTPLGEIVPDPAKYSSDNLKKLSPAQRAYYDEFMKMKSECDKMYPPGRADKYTTIKVMKTMFERAMSNTGLLNKMRSYGEGLKDSYLVRGDDADRVKAAMTDLNGKPVQKLPIMYTRLGEHDSENNVSMDTASALAAYSSMAHMYSEMSKCINVLEVGRGILQERKIQETKGDKGVVEIIKRPFSTADDIIRNVTQKGGERYKERLEDFFSMQVYQRYMDDSMTVAKKFNVGKMIDTGLHLSSSYSLAFNVLANISNVATGVAMMNIEAAAKEYFTAKDIWRADMDYKNDIVKMVAEHSSNNKTTKVALFGELFNVLQDYDTEARNKEYDKNTFVKKFGTELSFMMQNAGEHWMQFRTAMALANNFKVYDKNGKETSLWDALEVQDVDVEKKSGGKVLRLKGEYFSKDGKKFELSESQVTDLTLKMKGINQRMHGIYNREDKSAIQKMALGRMAMQFKKWVVPYVNRRFGRLEYNMDIGAEIEGYYRIAGRHIWKIVQEFKNGELNFSTDYMTEAEKANWRRARFEILQYLTIVAACMLMGACKGGDDDDDAVYDSWWFNTLYYQMLRLRTETGVMTIGMPNEALKIFQSPFASARLAEAVVNLGELFYPPSWMDIMESGRFEGHSRAFRNVIKATPINNIYKAADPEDAMMFYLK